MRGDKDDSFSLSGFLSTPKLSSEDWPDTFMRDLSRESVKDNFRQLFLPDNSPSLDKFLMPDDSLVGSPTEPQLVPEWFPFEDNSSHVQTSWVNWKEQSSRGKDATCSISSSSHVSLGGTSQRHEMGEKDSYVTSWSFQRPSFPQYPPSKGNSREQADPEKDFLMREFKKKIREAAVVRFRQKRKERNFANVVRYDCRKRVADARPRFKGRFVKVRKDDDCSMLYSKSSSSERTASLDKYNEDDFQVVPHLMQ